MNVEQDFVLDFVLDSVAMVSHSWFINEEMVKKWNKYIREIEERLARAGKSVQRLLQLLHLT